MSRIDIRAADLKMERMRNETKADMQAADLKMERMRNETKADMQAADLKMDRMSTETRLYNTFTLLVAVSAVVVPILLNKSS